MEMIITNNNVEYLEVRSLNDGNIAIVKKNKLDRAWDVRTFVLTKREALKLNQAISSIVLGYDK